MEHNSRQVGLGGVILCKIYLSFEPPPPFIMVRAVGRLFLMGLVAVMSMTWVGRVVEMFGLLLTLRIFPVTT